METLRSKLPEEILDYTLRQAQCLIWYTEVYGSDWVTTILNEKTAERWLPISRHPENSLVEDLFLARSAATQEEGDIFFEDAFHEGKTQCSREFPIILADGSQRWLHEDVHIEKIAPGHWRLVGVFTDVTPQKLSEQRLLHQAHHDPLTQLPNRAYLFQLLADTPPESQRYLLYLDLDNFKVINDTLGHPTGDFVLIQVANRLRQCISNQGDVIRLGGDEFTVLLRPGVGEQEAQALAELLLKQIRKPLLIEDNPLYLSASIGVASLPGSDAPTLLRNADIAMYAAKNGGKNRVTLFSIGMDTQVRSRFELESELRKAIELDEITLAFQPLFRLDTRELVGLEGLARWSHPTRGNISPDQFIPIAEETRLIIPLGKRLLEKGCLYAQHCRAQHPHLAVGLNISMVQLQEESFAEDVMQVLEKTGLPAGKLVLEVTESILATEHGHVINQLQYLYDAGVGLAMDDFGIGYSSLAALSEFPLHCLKVDRSFLQRATDPSPARAERNQALIRAIAVSARALDLLVVAEGVETEEQAKLALTLGCQLGQGYHLKRPMDIAALELYLKGVFSAPVHDLREALPLRLAA